MLKAIWLLSIAHYGARDVSTFFVAMLALIVTIVWWDIRHEQACK